MIYMGYLICNKCEGYYQLQEGESPKDFDRCQCGGTLEYVEEIENQKTGYKLLQTVNFRRIIGVVIGTAVIMVSFLISSPDPYSATFVYNNNISFYLWAAGGFIAALIAGGNIRSGASNGFYAACISGLLVLIIFYNTINPLNVTETTLPDTLAFYASLCAVYLLVPSLFSILGGLIASISRRILT
jgi:hypothetical protein